MYVCLFVLVRVRVYVCHSVVCTSNRLRATNTLPLFTGTDGAMHNAGSGMRYKEAIYGTLRVLILTWVEKEKAC